MIRVLTKDDVAKALRMRAGPAWDLCRRAGLVVPLGGGERVIEADLLDALRAGRLAEGATPPPKPRRQKPARVPTFAELK